MKNFVNLYVNLYTNANFSDSITPRHERISKKERRLLQLWGVQSVELPDKKM